jgi:hypothetical protein
MLRRVNERKKTNPEFAEQDMTGIRSLAGMAERFATWEQQMLVTVD